MRRFLWTFVFAFAISTILLSICLQAAEATPAPSYRAWPPPETLLSASSAATPTFRIYLPAVTYNYPPRPLLNPIPAPDANRFYTVTWQGVAAPFDHYVLEQARSADFSSVEQTWITTATSQVIGPVVCSAYYRVRADSSGGWGIGPWSNVERGVTPPPAPPVVSDISSVVKGAPYLVTWSDVGCPVESYLLQESTSPDFTVIRREWRTPAPSQVISSSLSYDTLYYRVRAENSDCWGESGWSNIKPFYPIYYDDFSDPSSGWPQKQVLVIPQTPDTPATYYHLHYQAGEYRIRLDQGGPPAWFRQPDAFAPYRTPTDKYCVETHIRVVKGQDPYQRYNYYPYWANGGLIFGARDDNKSLYMICLAIGAEKSPNGPADMGWYIAHNPENEWPYEGCHLYSIPRDMRGGQGTGLDTEWWHSIQVSVDDNRATVYIDGVPKGTWIMDGLEQTTRVGLLGGDYEVTPTDFRFDNFRVIPNASCVP